MHRGGLKHRGGLIHRGGLMDRGGLMQQILTDSHDNIIKRSTAAILRMSI